ncbi:MAG: penicillin-binding transpeptidase domain-containing protein [bacterium]|nr:penicillin-binding transpeptidase domain-containing protein [bacterium]
MRSQALDRASGRIVWIRLAGLAVVLLLAGRAAHLTVAHTRARDLYDQQIQTEQRLSAARGTIFDRNGRELAITTEAASIYALPREMEDRAATAHALAETLELDLTAIARRLSNRDGFTYIKRWVTEAQAERIRELDLPGVGIDREPRRSYPAGTFAAPLLGFANIDGQGVRGIEQLENDWLTGQPRSVRIERDARGRALALRSTDLREVAGGDVALTLDAAMQGAAEAALQEVVASTNAEGGLVLTMDPRNGDLLALAEAPGFDPNGFRTLDYRETRSRTFTDAVEAGSTMKAFLVASAIDARVIEPEQRFETGEDGSLRVRGKTIRDRRPFGPLAPADVLRVSSNVGAVMIAQALGREAQHAGLERFGFGARTRSRFPFESSGILRDWNDWQPVDQAAISFGQGLSVTGIQLVSALGALANDGMRMEPRIVLARRRPDQGWQTTEVRAHGRAVSPRAARLTLDMMQTVVSAEGTGRLAALDGVRVAGKTGTAQKLDVEAGRYSNSRYVAWFMGVVPADDPEIAIVVAVDEPKGALHSGGGIAAPLFARVAAAQLARRGIVTHPAPIPAAPVPTLLAEREDDGESADQAPNTATNATPTRLPDVAAAPPAPKTRPAPARRSRNEPPRAAVAAPPARPAATLEVAAGRHPSRAGSDDTFDLVFVPDFEGTTMARARRLAASESLEITTLGAIEGRVVSQYPIPGTVLEGSDRTVRLRFEQRRTASARREEG